MPPQTGSICLAIEEPTGVRRDAWPVHRGVPFPQGVLASPDHVRLLAPDGAEHPCTVETAARWPDGSVKWLVLDFAVTLAPQAVAVYRLEYGSGVARAAWASALRVEESAAAIEVDTGPLSFRLDRREFALLEDVRLHEPSGSPRPDRAAPRAFRELPALLAAQRVCVTGTDGVAYDMAGLPADEVVVEQRTARRVVIRARGRHADPGGRTFLDYLVRVYAWTDLPWVQVEYTFVNREESEHVDVAAVTVASVLGLGGPPAEAGDGGRLTGMCGSGRRTYVSPEPFCFRHDRLLERFGVFAGSPIYDQDGTRVAGVGMYEQQIARGWLDVSDGEHGVNVALRDFLPMYPKEAAWSGDCITFSLWPAWAPPLRLHQGAARTHIFLLHFHRGDGLAAGTGEVTAAFGEPLLPHNSAWYLESGAFGPVLPFSPQRYPRLERRLRELTVQARDQLSHGMIDYGDFVNPSSGSQGGFSTNNEPDRLHGFILQHLRSGERIPWQLAEAIAWHVVDVDVVHHSTRSALELGGQRIHGHGHVQYDAEGYPGVSVVPSHMWTEGLLEFHYLTGHAHMREVALGTGECLLKMVDAGWCRPPYHSNWHSVRDSGWPLIGMAAVFEATGDRRYLAAMQSIAAALAQAQHANGGWHIELLYHTGYCPFQIAVCLAGLGRYHEVSGNAQARAVFLQGIEFLAGDAMRFPDGAWTYVTTPEYRSTYTSASPMEPFGYAYLLTGDREMLRRAMRGWNGELDLRASPRFLWAAAAAGLLAD